PARKPPVLRTGGTYSGDQGKTTDTSRKPPELRNGDEEPADSSAKADDAPKAPAVPARISATMLTVPAIVMDRNGRDIANLHKEDFRVYEDGVEQKLAYFASVEKPFTVALMLDVSGSTKYQLEQITQAANTFLGRLRYNDQLLAMTFDGQIHVLTEAASVSA